MSTTVTAAEAAALLGVKKATLYSYVSRGLIRSYGSGRDRRYEREDLEALRVRSAETHGHAAAAASSMDWGAPVLDSALTSIDVDGPNYRGHPALDLAERDVAYERVAELLWTGELPESVAPVEVDGLGLDPGAFAALVPPEAPLATALGLGAHALSAADPLRGLWTPSTERDAARAAIRRLAALSARVVGQGDWVERARRSLAAPTVASAVVAAIGGSDAAVGPVNRALVLCADHELNASAFAARVAAGTGADLYGCLGAALATWSGPRHGAASEALEHALESEAWRLLDLPGFGHRLYPHGDPRGERLLRDAHALGSTDPRWLALRDLTDRLARAGHPPPNLDVGLVAIAAAAGLPPRSAQLVFGVGRFAGWVAHAWEQRAAGRMVRPRARYTGP